MSTPKADSPQNLVNSLNLPLSVTYEIGAAVSASSTAPRQFIPDLDFPDLRSQLTRVGVSLDNLVSLINNGTVVYYTTPPGGVPPTWDRSDPLGALLAIVRILSVVVLQTVLGVRLSLR
jgi:hypothetical protein